MAGQKAKKPISKAAPKGRPSGYTAKQADVICALLADGQSLVTICKDEKMPHRATVLRWVSERPEFCDMYVRAREAQADKLAEEIIAIADDGSNDTYRDEEGRPRTDQDVIARSRLRVDARKWYAAKVAPKKYGDKIQVGGAEDLPPVSTVHELSEAALLAIAAGRRT